VGSVYYALSHGIVLTEAEVSAILFFDKTDDKMAELHNSMTGDLLKMGSVLAIKHEQIKHNEYNCRTNASSYL
jgi:hypothetical protein